MAKSFWDKEELILTIAKNNSQNIDVKRCEKNEKSYIDIRVSKVDKDLVYHPTASGVAIPEANWSEIVNKVNELIKV